MPALRLLAFLAVVLLRPPAAACGQDLPFVATAALPDLLRLANGSAVASASAWHRYRRPELKQQLEQYILGRAPAEVPRLASATILNRTATASLAAESLYIRLTFATRNNATFVVEVLAPLHSGVGPPPRRPVFLTQWNHRSWAVKAVNRGFVACRYPGGDTGDSTGQFQTAYPNATWMKIYRRAWLGSRALDYVLTRSDADASKVSITGHSRNGKQSLIAAAFDERITAVVGSSPGTPIAAPIRFSSPQYQGETLAFINEARGWWLPSLKEYLGRECDLPVDGNAVIALIAPRHALLATGYTDHEGDITYADEANYRSAQQVYRLLGASDALRMSYRPGDHHGFLDPNVYFDWYDAAFHGDTTSFPEQLLHAFDWDAWNMSASFNRTPPLPTAPLEERIAWVLGETPPRVFTSGSSYAEENYEWVYPSVMLGHLPPAGSATAAKVTHVGCSIGDYVTANLYFPTAHGDEPLKVVVYIHGLSYNQGFVPGYMKNDPGAPDTGPIYTHLAEQGYFVITYDQLGMGIRVKEDAPFYARYPNSSKFARMVSDAHAAVDFAYCRSAKGAEDPRCHDGEAHGGAYPDRLAGLPLADMGSVALVGYGMGGAVALHAAAGDPRVTAVASLAGVPAWRQAMPASTGGLARFYQWFGLLPRLGFFDGRPSAVPYGYDELMASLAPRHLLLYTPKRDRDTVFAEVAQVAMRTRDHYNATGDGARFSWQAPDRINILTNSDIAAVTTWLLSLP